MFETHIENPELWFRPSPVVSLVRLRRLINQRLLTATIRYGKRDETHEKGYVPEQLVTLRLFDEVNQQILERPILIQSVTSFQIKKIKKRYFQSLKVYLNCQSIQEDLSFFERRPVHQDEFVSLVTFKYQQGE